jgi:hypothetical protein
VTRTHDLLITNQLLYRLSYTSISNCSVIIARFYRFVNAFFSEASAESKAGFLAAQRIAAGKSLCAS